jgi:hypothetical protein
MVGPLGFGDGSGQWAVGSGQWGGNTSQFAVAPLSSRAARRLLFITCTYVYMSDAILGVTRAQNQLATFRILKIFLRLELPRSRQRIAQIRASNLARGCGVAIGDREEPRRGNEHEEHQGERDGRREEEEAGASVGRVVARTRAIGLTLARSVSDWIVGRRYGAPDCAGEFGCLRRRRSGRLRPGRSGLRGMIGGRARVRRASRFGSRLGTGLGVCLPPRSRTVLEAGPAGGLVRLCRWRDDEDGVVFVAGDRDFRIRRVGSPFLD